MPSVKSLFFFNFSLYILNRGHHDVLIKTCRIIWIRAFLFISFHLFVYILKHQAHLAVLYLPLDSLFKE